MKLQIKETRTLALEYPDTNTPQDTLAALARARSATEILAAIKAAQFPLSAFTTEPRENRIEFIVECVMSRRVMVLDYLFDTLGISPNFISKLGDPLMFYAIQSSAEVTRYLLSKGADIFVDGGLLTGNSKKTLRMTTYASTGNVLLNVILHQQHKITDPDTKIDVIVWALQSKRSFDEYSRLAYSLHNTGLLTNTLRMMILQRLIHDNSDDCAVYSYFSKALEESDTRKLFAVASEQPSLNAYSSLAFVFPNFQLIPPMKNK